LCHCEGLELINIGSKVERQNYSSGESSGLSN